MSDTINIVDAIPTSTIAALTQKQIVKAQETTALMQQVVDTRITRTELLDIITEKIRDEVNAEVKALDKEIAATNAILTKSAALRILKNVDAQVHIDRKRTYDCRRETYVDSGFTLSVRIEGLSEADLPAKYRTALKRAEELDKKRDILRSKINRINQGKQRARMEMLRNSLESTEEGRKILEAIDGLKERVRSQITGDSEEA